MKNNQTPVQGKESFYTMKRAIFRKADQMKKCCNADVFVCVHHKNTDKIFSYTTSQDFKLEEISDLILREVRDAAFLKRV